VGDQSCAHYLGSFWRAVVIVIVHSVKNQVLFKKKKKGFEPQRWHPSWSLFRALPPFHHWSQPASSCATFPAQSLDAHSFSFFIFHFHSNWFSFQRQSVKIPYFFAQLLSFPPRPITSKKTKNKPNQTKKVIVIISISISISVQTNGVVTDLFAMADPINENWKRKKKNKFEKLTFLSFIIIIIIIIIVIIIIIIIIITNYWNGYSDFD
jgi:hypothetical protein